MIKLIVAADRKLGIAKHGFQPWYIPKDEQFFTEQTKSCGGKVLTGRKTFQTFKGPLPDRKNYILTRQTEPIQGVELVHDLNTFLADFRNDKDLWVAGGSDVYAQIIQAGMADEIYLTHIDADFGCDQFFPPYEEGFKLAEQSDQQEENGFKFVFAKYVPH